MYNRDFAVKYALKWCKKRNPLFYDFEKLGGDCTNFVSQCLRAGGYLFDERPNGWFYKSLFNRAPAWSGVNQLCEFVLSNQNMFFPKAKIVNCNLVEIGDIVQIDMFGKSFHHSAIITKKSGENLDDIYVCCHTTDRKNFCLKNYNAKNLRFLHFE